MIVKGTNDLIRQFMLKNHIEYLDASGWNKYFYHELSEDERELALDLSPIYTYLEEYVASPIIERMEASEGADIAYINHFGVDMEGEVLFMELMMVDGTRQKIALN